MRVIILKTGEVIDVKNGYARNYLLPKKIAIPATEENIRLIEGKKLVENKRKERELKKLNDLATELEKDVFVIKVKSGPDKKIFGAVTSDKIAEIISTKVDTEKIDVLLDEPIRSIGTHVIQVRLKSDIINTDSCPVANIKLKVIE